MALKTVVKLSSIALLLLFVSVCGGLFFLPKPPLLEGIPFSRAVYDSKHQLLRLTLSFDEKYRLYTPLSKISPQLITATLLQEDQYYWQHFGVNPVAILKATWQTYIVHQHRMGASTISMQTARLRFHIRSKTFTGKLLQIVRAIQLERYYSKAEILEAYLNLAPYGNNIEGIGAASYIYFNHAPHDLTLPEALTLSIIPQNPNQRLPGNPKLQSIRNKLFDRWVQTHPQDTRLAPLIHLPMDLHTLHQLPFLAPHLVNDVLTHSANNQHEIATTLDARLQTLITRITQQYIVHKKSLGVANAAVLLVDTRDLQIKALLGSVDFFNKNIQGQINGTNIKRSPGSSLKPFIYGLAFDQGLIHPNTMLKDVPKSFGAYNPENFDYDFMGPVKAKDALILSRNIPAIYLASLLANPSLYELLVKAQISHLKPESYYGLALSLGGAELTMQELVSLYAMLANDGLWHPLRLRQEEPLADGIRLLSPEASFLVLDCLKDTPRPDARLAAFGPKKMPISWKTGTSSGYRDAWSIGLFGPYVLAVWIGNFDNQGNPAFIGKKIAAPLFFELIEGIQQEFSPVPVLAKYPETLNLTHIDICKASGLIPTRFCQDTEKTWFIPGVSPIKSDTIYREVAINPKTGLRTCHFDKDTQFAIYEFWPSDLLKTFKQAGIQRRGPPPFEPGCSHVSNKGMSPQMTSPQSEVDYIISVNAKAPMKIPLAAVTDADVSHSYWFINGSYYGESTTSEPLFWSAKPGKFTIRVVDDHGLSDTKDIIVRVAG